MTLSSSYDMGRKFVVLSFMSRWTTSQIHFDLVPPFFIRYGHYDGPFVCVCEGEIRRRRALARLSPSENTESRFFFFLNHCHHQPTTVLVFSVTTQPGGGINDFWPFFLFHPGPSACVRWPLDNGRHEERTHGLLNPPPQKELHSFLQV